MRTIVVIDEKGNETITPPKLRLGMPSMTPLGMVRGAMAVVALRGVVMVESKEIDSREGLLEVMRETNGALECLAAGLRDAVAVTMLRSYLYDMDRADDPEATAEEAARDFEELRRNWCSGIWAIVGMCDGVLMAEGYRVGRHGNGGYEYWVVPLKD